MKYYRLNFAKKCMAVPHNPLHKKITASLYGALLGSKFNHEDLSKVVFTSCFNSSNTRLNSSNTPLNSSDFLPRFLTNLLQVK